MNNFLIRLLLRICYFTASVLWGIMGFLQFEKNKCLKLPKIYDSIDHFRDEFSKLSTCQQQLDVLTLQYDNFAIFFGGFFLVLYALKQKNEKREAKKKPFWSAVLILLLFLGIVYMALDWTENYCFLHANNREFTFGHFKWLQLSKWGIGLFTLIALMLTDILIFRNWRGILWGIFGFLVINWLVSKSFSMYRNSIPFCKEYTR